MPRFLHLFFFDSIDTFIHKLFIQKHSLRPISMSSHSSQRAEPPWGADAEPYYFYLEKYYNVTAMVDFFLSFWLYVRFLSFSRINLLDRFLDF